MVKIGDRVGAILKADAATVYLLGYGIYVGDCQHPELSYIPSNPKIILDDGSIVWGFQCWWGTEEKVKQIIGDREVIMTTINSFKE